MQVKISKTKIKNKAKRKLNPEIVETINLATKNEKWLQVAKLLSRPKRKQIKVNLEQIEKQSAEGDTLVIPGKVLGQGSISKRVRVAAFSFSEEALEKLKERKCEIVSIKEEINKNKNAQGIKILK